MRAVTSDRADPWGRRIRHAAEYLLLRGALLLLSRLSPAGMLRVGRALGRFAFDGVRIRRRVTLDNLAHAFPEWSPEKRLAVARECYRQFGVTFLELTVLPRLARQSRSLVRFSDPGQFDRARAESRGAVLFTGHLGNWELSGAAVASLGHPTWVLVRRQRNRRVDALVTRSRENAGLRVLPTDRGLRPVLQVLKANAFVAILADQDAGQDGVFVPFFGRPASTPLGPVRFARLARCPIILGLCVRKPDGRYEVEMPPSVHVRTDLPPPEAEREALGRAVCLLEEAIRRHPEQWFWMHRRWKTRPPEEKRPAPASASH